LLLATAALSLAPIFAATVTGSVKLIDSEPGVSKDYFGVVIWLERSDGTALPVSPTSAQMAQRKKHFVPSMVAVPVGSTVSFPNFDPIFHNAFSTFAGQIFDVGLYPPGTDEKVRFHKPGVVLVYCNIHPTMRGVIVVVNTPYVAVSNSDGSFHMVGVTAGEYRLHVYHERATQHVLDTLERDLVVDGNAVSIPPLEISESGYIQLPHKNKFGKDYPPVIEDRPMYHVGRKP